MAKQKFDRELKIKITARMDEELESVGAQAGLFRSEIIRNGTRNELTRLKKELRETFLSPADYKLVRDQAAERGITNEDVLHELINHTTHRQRHRKT